MKSHEIEYKIHGNDLQMVEVILDPKETVIAEAGAMNWMDSDITFETKMGDGTETKGKGFLNSFLGAGKRVFSGGSFFLTHFTNNGTEKKSVSFASTYPGSIVPIDLKKIGGDFFCQKEAFLCAAKGTKVDIVFVKKFGSGFFGGEGFILEKITGDGLAFIHAGGTVVEKKLKNQKIVLDTGCIAGFSGGIDYSVQKAGNLKSMFFGGEGFFLATLEGTGSVYLQSLPFSRLVNEISTRLPNKSN